ncbi:Protein of uncharacterised function (DUF3521) [Escherichia coli]|uniref:Protein of uncharacterized function (DUF3521) n=1 Tax=Escherichia coli TaxID=562 RepID=A0A2X3J743_ECOLX|nr:Protein of uncharacterised function (DUF3521) [Escherichia coli]
MALTMRACLMRYAYQAYENLANVLNFHDFVGRVRR